MGSCEQVQWRSEVTVMAEINWVDEGAQKLSESCRENTTCTSKHSCIAGDEWLHKNIAEREIWRKEGNGKTLTKP